MDEYPKRLYLYGLAVTVNSASEEATWREKHLEPVVSEPVVESAPELDLDALDSPAEPEHPHAKKHTGAKKTGAKKK